MALLPRPATARFAHAFTNAGSVRPSIVSSPRTRSGVPLPSAVAVKKRDPGIKSGITVAHKKRPGVEAGALEGWPIYAVDQSILGSVSNWWNGGGLDSVHSSVVAPSPQGLSGAFLPAISDQITLTKKIAMPAAMIM